MTYVGIFAYLFQHLFWHRPILGWHRICKVVLQLWFCWWTYAILHQLVYGLSMRIPVWNVLLIHRARCCEQYDLFTFGHMHAYATDSQVIATVNYPPCFFTAAGYILVPPRIHGESGSINITVKYGSNILTCCHLGVSTTRDVNKHQLWVIMAYDPYPYGYVNGGTQKL